MDSIIDVNLAIKIILTVIVIEAVVLSLAYVRAKAYIWSMTVAVGLIIMHSSPMGWAIWGVGNLLFVIPLTRRFFVSSFLVQIIKKLKLLPSISQTEETALRAGTTWIDADLFSGRPDFDKISKEYFPTLSKEEQAFLDGPVEKVCEMTDDWEVFNNKDLPKKTWDFLKKEKFLGMIIPKKYGGLEFSAAAHSTVIQKLGSRCSPLAISVMVPNSLGPAELLIHYGTEKQKNHYLPRLAGGKDIPCFALTEPGAGSDAGSITSSGELLKNKGKLFIKLNWNKRYITLAAISTLIGLAFKLRDPKNLLGGGEDLGITCALIPSNTKGVVLGNRHDPLGVPFYNCPTRGKDVIIPIEYVIGEEEGVGNGWKMLMECLAAGRGISLPATATGGAKLVSRVVSAYGNIRQQFGLNIGKFEGIEEPMARIGGLTYLMDSARLFTTGSIDKGNKPPVITAICKYHFTEMAREIINDGMDILGGAAISRGPRNLLAHGYISIPISITVEGANIMTRSLIHFGQGAIRCHPYAYKEIEALNKGDVKEFDIAFWSHIGHVVSNGVRALLLSLSRGWISLPNAFRKNGQYYRRLAWMSASFAFLADLALALLGGDIKRKEKITGRFGDILSWMYLNTCVLRRYEAGGNSPKEKIYLEWTMEYGFAKINSSFIGLYQNIFSSSNPFGWVLKNFITLWSRINPVSLGPSDILGHKIASSMLDPGVMRDKLTEGIFISSNPEDALYRYEDALSLITQSIGVEKKMKKAMSRKLIPKNKLLNSLEAAIKKGIITSEEAKTLQLAEMARQDAVEVDHYSLKDYQNGKMIPQRNNSEPRTRTKKAITKKVTSIKRPIKKKPVKKTVTKKAVSNRTNRKK